MSALRIVEKGSFLWRTPLASDGKRGGTGTQDTASKAYGLNDQIKRWPTPVTTDAKSSARGTTTTSVMHPGMSLIDAIRKWPTPTASSYGSSNNGCPGDGREEYATKGAPSLETTARREGGVLNPAWVECLMGFPIGWTDGPPDPATLLLFGSLPAP